MLSDFCAEEGKSHFIEDEQKYDYSQNRWLLLAPKDKQREGVVE